MIDTHKPDIIVVNAGDNQFLEGGLLVMGIENIYDVYVAAATAPNTKNIASHMDAVNFWTLSREGLMKKRYPLIF